LTDYCRSDISGKLSPFGYTEVEMYIKTPRDFGAIIREVRRHNGMSQTDLARALRTSQSWVSEVESGKPTAEIGMVLKALSVLGISIDAQPSYQPDARPQDIPPYTI